MATRDLTVTYLRLRSALHRKAPGREDQGGGLLTNSEGGYVVPGTSPVYVEMVTDTQGDLTGIESKSESQAPASWSARFVGEVHTLAQWGHLTRPLRLPLPFRSGGARQAARPEAAHRV